MIEIYNRHNIEFNQKPLDDIADLLTTRDIELMIIDDEEIEEVNFKYRDKKSPTDVLSFPLEHSLQHLPLGTILISFEMAKNRAFELGHSIDEEIALLFLHGILHLLGYDHEIDNGEQRERESEIIKRLSLPDSLIIRSDSE